MKTKAPRLNVSEVRQLYLDGMTLQEVSEKLKTSIASVYAICADITRPQGPGPHLLSSDLSEATRAEIHQLRKQGWTLAKIAQKYGVSPSTIWRIVRAERAGKRVKRSF